MSGPYHINKYPLQVHQGVDLTQRAAARMDALVKALEQIGEAAHKGSLTPAERLQDIRIILGRVGTPPKP